MMMDELQEKNSNDDGKKKIMMVKYRKKEAGNGEGRDDPLFPF